ncbi:MAG TPA: ribonuclease H family protein [Paludibacteraceae bacterium]|jgi:ribonuclease HI|nr:ribonuclease H family protein [Paludibacteraceae bacterium]HOU68122.1 ribonuclease H family protein [Paludibacteraceae bacterium]HPH62730.1 ribonuclease H family protein [Paludibacteraceae bacterium]HQF50028.1 ribonuclease H family protein [Paludibacteraceae bacterium]HQJ90589.1 ribonuclease H family protein [Paludibacteraceae bacterium]
MANKRKYYVVWKGRNPGIYTDWDGCKAQIENFPNALYKSFESEEQAEEAFSCEPKNYLGRRMASAPKIPIDSNIKPELEALAVDAACSGNPGKMEYRGVYVRNGAEAFHVGPFEQGTNNIGEFLALVHGLAYLKQYGFEHPIYSDSENAISWVKQKKCRTKLILNAKNAVLFDMIARAEKWLATNTYKTKIMKWETAIWGEIPADFGRK